MAYGRLYKTLGSRRRAVYNTANYAIKRALGAATALAAARNLRKKSKSKLTVRKPVMKRTARRVNSSYPSYTLTRRRRTVRQNHSTENQAISLQVKAQRPSAMKLVQCAMEPQWYRIQGLSQYDTNYGFFPVANRLETNGTQILPMHIWDITSLPNVGSGGIVTPNAGYVCALNASSEAVAFPLNSQQTDGSIRSNDTRWTQENVTNLDTDSYAHRKAFHHWSHIKMNLYGVRKRATRFLVQLVMINEDYGDFLNASGGNLEKKKIYDYLARPFMYNNLNSGDPQTAADIKILKTYEVIVAPNSLDDFGGTNAVPHMQTVNWFVNHNRVRKYDWKRGAVPVTLNNAGYDTETNTGHETRVEPKYRVYLMVRALSPERRTLVGGNTDNDADPLSEPSYDLVIRNKFSVPT